MSEIPPAQPADSDFLAMIERPKLSVAAIAGFILSFLFVLAPIGILLGIVGIFRTRGGRRRGMGFAIASLPIGFITGSLTVVMSMALWVFYLMGTTAIHSTEFLQSSRVVMAEKAADAYEGFSKRFKLEVDEDRFAQWAMQVAIKHGTLQKIEPPDAKSMKPRDDDTSEINMTGQFVNGPATVSVTIGFDGLEPEIDDITVDGVSPKGLK
jgi:hypothetical protein